MSKSRELRQSRELLGMIGVLIAVVLSLALYSKPGTAGVLGDAIRQVCLGLWGPLVYGLPVIPLMTGLILLLGREHRSPRQRIVHAVLVFSIAAGLWHLLNFSLEDTRALLQLLRSQHSTLDPTAPLPASLSFELFWNASVEPQVYLADKSLGPGGIIGGIMATSLETLLGFYGALAVMILMLLVELFILFNFSISYFFQRLKDQRQESGGQVRALVDLALERSQTRYMEDQMPPEEDPIPMNEPRGLTLAQWNEQFRDTWLQEEADEVGGEFPIEETIEHEPIEEVPSQKPKQASPWFTEFFQEAPKPNHEREVTAKILDDIEIESFEDEAILIGTNTESQMREPDPEVVSDAPTSDVPSFDASSGEVVEPLDSHEIEAEIADVEIETAAAEEETDSQAEFAEDDLFEAETTEDDVTNVPMEVPGPEIKQDQEPQVIRPYILPPLSLLKEEKKQTNAGSRERVQRLAKRLIETLKSFGVEAKLEHITTGPTITRFELSPGPGVKVSRIVGLSDDIALNLAATGVRIEAPIPGKSAIGIEIPNEEKRVVELRSLLESQAWRETEENLIVPLGRDIPGAPIICDIKRMPHLLIAGATGSGKSICINTILISILYRATPKDVRLLMIDPKVVELSVYNGIPHLLAPVVTDPKKAANTLNWAVDEMTRRYALFAQFGVRNAEAYNELIVERRESIRRARAEGEHEVLLQYQDEDERRRKRAEAQNMNVRESSIFPADEELPHILVVIDELSDLMQTSPKEVEDSIARLTAMARAAGIHLIIATQRPSVDVITGVIKANIPSRVAFAVSSQIDSRTILDQAGAEKLLGKGDLLYSPQDRSKPVRGQGAFVSSVEVERVLDFIRDQQHETTDPEIAAEIMATGSTAVELDSDEERDELYEEAMDVLLDVGYASVSILQRRLNVGYPRAARLIDTLEQDGLVGPFEGSKPRVILVDRTAWEALKASQN